MTTHIELKGRKHTLTIQRGLEGEGYRVLLDGLSISADVEFVSAGVVSLLIEGKSYRVCFDPREEAAVTVKGQRLPYKVENPRALPRRAKIVASEPGTLPIAAPMPGLIVHLLVGEGDKVDAGQSLLVMEAMKMQNELKAPRVGTVSRVAVEAGATVPTGALLLTIE